MLDKIPHIPNNIKHITFMSIGTRYSVINYES